MADPVKRLHYFNHQFLREKDFTDEQKYHIEMRRRHNRLLHTFGIAQGLEVPNAPAGATAVTVNEGTAYDSQGREIVLADNRVVELQGAPANSDVYVTISYRELETDQSNETGAEGKTRFTEDPLIETLTTKPAQGDKLILARARRSGTAITEIDRSDRKAAGVVAGDLEVRSLTLKNDGVTPANWPSLRGSDRRVDVAGSLSVTGNINLTGTLTGALAANSVGAAQLGDNAVTAAKIQDGSVGTAELADNAVNSAKILDGSVGASELANNAVTDAKIANDTITFKKLNTRKVWDSAVTLAAGQTSGFNVLSFQVANPVGSHIVVHAFTTTHGGSFEWKEISRTAGPVATPIVNQNVLFTNTSSIPIEVKFKIYAIDDV